MLPISSAPAPVPIAHTRIGSDRDVPPWVTQERKELVDWAMRVTLGMDDARPGHCWFAATFHPCAGGHPDLEVAAIRPTEAIKAFDRRISAALTGKRWRDKPHRRMWGVLIGQRGAEAFHFHGGVAVPAEAAERLEFVAPAIWKRCAAPYGTLVLDRLNDAGWFEYAARQAGWDPISRFPDFVSVLVLPLLGQDRRLAFEPRPARLAAWALQRRRLD